MENSNQSLIDKMKAASWSETGTDAGRVLTLAAAEMLIRQHEAEIGAEQVQLGSKLNVSDTLIEAINNIGTWFLPSSQQQDFLNKAYATLKPLMASSEIRVIEDSYGVEMVRHALLNVPASFDIKMRAEIMWEQWIKPFLPKQPDMKLRERILNDPDVDDNVGYEPSATKKDSLEESIPETIYVWRHGDDEPINGMFLECDDSANPGIKYVRATKREIRNECPYCEGTGLIATEHLGCSQCNGTGKKTVIEDGGSPSRRTPNRKA